MRVKTENTAWALINIPLPIVPASRVNGAMHAGWAMANSRFGRLADIGVKQKLVNTAELGSCVACDWHIAAKDEDILSVVDVSKLNGSGEVEEIRAL